MSNSRFDEFLSLSSPQLGDLPSSNPLEDLSWIMEMLEERPPPVHQPNDIDNSSSSVASLERPAPDVVPSTSNSFSAMAGTSFLLVPLEQVAERQEPEEEEPVCKEEKAPSPEKKPPSSSWEESLGAESVSGYDWNLWGDKRWSSPNTNSQLWPSERVSCYSTLSTQTVGNVFFFVDGGEPGWRPSASLKASVVDENNNQLFVEISKENTPASRRCVCTFFAPTPGCYAVTVCDGLLSFHVKGSPFIIPVNRNYKMYSTWLKPRPFYSKAVKAWGVTYSSHSKRVYVTDRDAHQVIIYHENGTLDKCFGRGGHLPAELFRPTGIAVDSQNHRLIITDKDNHRVCLYTLDGSFLFCFGSKGFKNGEFNYPWGVSVSPKDATIAIADSRNHRVQLFDNHGTFLRKYSVFETNPFEYKGEFNYPRGITFDKTGENLYVTDFNIQTVFKLNVELTERTKISPPGVHLSRPQGIAVDSVGNILLCDSRNNCIRVLSSTGAHISSIVGHVTDSFVYPQDITIAPTGEIIVVDSFSNVRVL